MVGLIIAAICAFATIAGVAVAMYFSVRGMRRETLNEAVESARWRTEIGRDIGDNSKAIIDLALTFKTLVIRLDSADREFRDIAVWKAEIEKEIQRVDSRAQQAFSRHDDRKKEYEEAMREINGLKDIMRTVGVPR